MEDFECPPQDDAPLGEGTIESCVERRRAELLENVRAVMPGLMVRWELDGGSEGFAPQLVSRAFGFAEEMLAQAEQRAVEYEKKLLMERTAILESAGVVPPTERKVPL